jgi:putative flippase GtrA
VKFFLVSIAGFAANWSVSVSLYNCSTFFHRYYLISASVGVLCGFAINFAGSKLMVFKH